MIAWLDRDLTTLAFCWRFDRNDGVTLGFTSHDRDIVVDGLVYRAAPGMLPSAVSISDGFDIDTLDVSGALTSDAVTETDLLAGRWDGAAVRLFGVDWEAAGAGRVPLARGVLGDVSVRDGAFSAELSGPTALLERPVVEATSPECRAELGDKRCRVDMAGRVRTARITSLVDAVTLTVDTPEASANAYTYGTLRFLDGANSALSRPILRSDGQTIVLRLAPRLVCAVGERVELIEGCDKSFDICRARFANGINFRGEPYLPGNDLLTRYPGS